MEAEKRILRVRKKIRKPLSDSTNLTTTTTAPNNLSSAFKKLLPSTNSTTANSDVISSAPPPPQPNLASPPARLLKSSSPHGAGVDSEVSESGSVYSRRNIANKRKGKGKETAEPLSCPPAVKIGNVWNKINKDGEKSLPKACTAPPKKRQHRVNVSDYALPDEFIKQQRDYFAEIDAFEMEEEEVESLDQLE
ncbi:uncharacterized protein LOC115955941 [Quercus lobata]|uniref:Uncharacterized protein n=1 Tax=Quercus lobata TaxID=97700 RepID=A0A7N2R9Y4_QUELO|nr:uncharacterized protein LOC115955941 [Quercus lobata]